MKRLICIVGCLMSGSHVVHAMEGAAYGGMTTAFVGLCQVADSSDSVGSKIVRFTCATAAGTAMGGLSQLLLRALQKHQISVAATATVAVGCGFAQVLFLSKMISN
jgi:hypothetical protein